MDGVDGADAWTSAGVLAGGRGGACVFTRLEDSLLSICELKFSVFVFVLSADELALTVI